MTSADQALQQLVRLRGYECDPEIYRRALMSWQALIIAEVCRDITLDLLQVERLMTEHD